MNTTPTTPIRKVYSVSELNRSSKSLLENHFGLVWIEGEVSNLSIPQSGHWYFTLKDQNAQINCAFFKGKKRYRSDEILKQISRCLKMAIKY